MSNVIHRQACAEIHTRLAIDLKDYCWNMRVDCVVVDRAQLESRLGVARTKGCRLSWLREDVSFWFPHFTHTVSSGTKVHSCYLSQLPFPEGPITGKMSSAARQLRLREAGLKTAAWSAGS